jgi:hypothetical protein
MILLLAVIKMSLDVLLIIISSLAEFLTARPLPDFMLGEMMYCRYCLCFHGRATVSIYITSS